MIYLNGRATFRFESFVFAPHCLQTARAMSLHGNFSKRGLRRERTSEKLSGPDQKPNTSRS